MSRNSAIVATLFLAATVILTKPELVVAQKNKPDPTPPATKPSAPTAPAGSSSTNMSAANEAFMELELLVSGKVVTGESEDRSKRLAQLNEDFNRLQQINSEKVAPLLRATSVDYKELSRAMSEIKNRASRIKYNIPIGLKDKTGEKVQYDTDASQVAPMLPELSRIIESFLGNPVFHVSSPNDAELRSRAGRDLDGIIKLSNAINKIAKRLSKGQAPSQ
ncbi:MAG TPA: hypothetical protein VGL29_08065 [Blastocatellia bacterium]